MGQSCDLKVRRNSCKCRGCKKTLKQRGDHIVGKMEINACIINARKIKKKNLDKLKLKQDYE